MRRQRNAFTLVELLVVVAIIALLLGILLPALGKARATARNVDCLSRMRSISTATVSYSVENKGRIPAAFGGTADEPRLNGETGDGRYFTDYLEPFMDVGSDQQSDFYLCPDSTLEPEEGQKRMSYSANPLLMVNLLTSENRGRMSRVKRPASVMLVSDTSQNSGAGTSGPTWSGPFMGPFFDEDNAEEPLEITEEDNVDGVPTNGFHYRFRHLENTSGNAGFVDGHADSFQLGKVKQSHLATAY